jgi:hypothetical protein
MRRSDNGGVNLINERQSMVADVVAHSLAPGMSRKQAIALLGEPDWQSPPQDSTLANYLPEMRYFIHYNGSEVDALTITFTPRQQVVRYSAKKR